jgi:4-hydroxy-tetrahydrodipicolinate reductase
MIICAFHVALTINYKHMKIALIGYGKMGRAIEQVAQQRGHEIVARIDANPSDWKQIEEQKPDVAIEFSVPGIAAENIKRCLEAHIPVLSGTTGWLEQKPFVDALALKNNTPFFYASNYSLGVNLFFKLNEYLAQLMQSHTQYQVSMEEIHHTQKKDAPSGTAITLAEGIIKNLGSKTEWILSDSTKPSENQISISAKRIDPYPGEHTVWYRSPIDAIEIKHTAHSREGFALGAVLVAEWLPDQKGVLDMNNFL